MRKIARLFLFLILASQVSLSWSKPTGLCDELFSSEIVLNLDNIHNPPFWFPVEPEKIPGVLSQIQSLNSESSRELDQKLRQIMHVEDDTFDKRAPKKADDETIAKLAKAMNLVDVGDIFTVRAGFGKSPRQIDIQKASILATLDGILQGNYVKDQEMVNLRLMVDLVRDLKPRSEALRADTGKARKVIETTHAFLKSKRNEIKAHFAKSDAKPFLMLMPEYNAAKKEYFLTMRVINSMTRYNEIILALEKQKHQFHDIETRMENYEQDYIDLQYLAKTFLNIERSKFRYHDKITEDGTKTSHRAEVEKMFRELESSFDGAKEIHPNLWEIRWRQGWEFVSNGFRKTWKKITGGLIITGALIAIFTQPEFFISKGANVYNSTMDNQNIEDTSYWIEKCSKQTNLKKLQECLESYQDLLMAHTQKKISKKQETLKDYPGREELLKSQQQFQLVLNSVIPIDENSPDRLELAMSVYRTYAIEYQIQGLFNKWKIRLQKMEEEEAAKLQAQKELKAPLTPPAPLPPPSLDFLKQSVEDEAKALREFAKDKDKSAAEKTKALIDYMDKMTAIKMLIEQTNKEFGTAAQELLETMSKAMPDENEVPTLSPKELQQIDRGSANIEPTAPQASPAP